MKKTFSREEQTMNFNEKNNWADYSCLQTHPVFIHSRRKRNKKCSMHLLNWEDKNK